MSLLKGISPQIIDALTRGIRPALRDELRNFLSGRITRVPEQLEPEFNIELRGLVQQIGEGGFGGISSVAGEVAGMIEGGLIIGKSAQIVNSVSDLIKSREDQLARERTREQLARDINRNPEQFERLPPIGTPEDIVADIERSIRDRERSARKEGKMPSERTIRFRDPKRTGRKVVEDIFDDIDLDDPEPEFELKDDDLPVPPFFIPPKIPGLFRKGTGRRPGFPQPEKRKRKQVFDEPSQPDEPDIISQSIARGLGFQRQQIPQRTLTLPDDTKSYNYIEFTRIANANNLFQDNIFNTSF